MAEYIERKAAIIAIKNLYPGIPFAKIRLQKWHDENKNFMECELAIERIPAADVVPRDCYDRLLAENDELRKERPVVRCADCKYNITPDKLYAQCNFNYAIGPQDFFCKAGERKDGDGDV